MLSVVAIHGMTRVFVLLVLVISTAAVAGAQTPQPAIEVRGGFGLSHYLHGDLDYSAPAWLAAVRFGRGPIAVEGEFAGASHEERQVFGPVPGSSVQTVTISSDRYRSVGVNVLGRWGGRVSAFAGGGAGLYWEPSEYRVEAGENSYEQDRMRGPRPGAQLVAGLDIPIASRVKAFGQFRYEMRSFEDPGGGSVVQGLAGVSIALR